MHAIMIVANYNYTVYSRIYKILAIGNLTTAQLAEVLLDVSFSITFSVRRFGIIILQQIIVYKTSLYSIRRLS